MSSRASTSRCQGLTPRELQPEISPTPRITHTRPKRQLMFSPKKPLLFGQQLTYLRFIDRAIDRSKSHVRETSHAMMAMITLEGIPCTL
jgi:hypothetical protein